MWKCRIKSDLNYYADALELVKEKVVKHHQPPVGANEGTLKKYNEDLVNVKKQTPVL